jgi:hypothetical protein
MAQPLALRPTETTSLAPHRPHLKVETSCSKNQLELLEVQSRPKVQQKGGKSEPKSVKSKENSRENGPGAFRSDNLPKGGNLVITADSDCFLATDGVAPSADDFAGPCFKRQTFQKNEYH